MYILVNILFLIIFLFSLFFFNIPDINNSNYITHKIIIAIALFITQFILLVISKIKNKCKIDINEILMDSLQVSLTGFIAYTIYTDYIYRYQLVPYANIDKHYHNIILALIITFAIATVKIIRTLINPEYMKCQLYD